jgi:hypothetical protein
MGFRRLLRKCNFLEELKSKKLFAKATHQSQLNGCPKTTAFYPLLFFQTNLTEDHEQSP